VDIEHGLGGIEGFVVEGGVHDKEGCLVIEVYSASVKLRRKGKGGRETGLEHDDGDEAVSFDALGDSERKLVL
jgi:hypothetical protein